MKSYKEIFNKAEATLRSQSKCSEEEFNSNFAEYQNYETQIFSDNDCFNKLILTVFYSGFKAETVDNKLDVIKNYFILTALIVAVLFRMTGGVMLKLQPLWLFVLGFLFAVPIPILVYPVNHVIADSSLYLTVFLFAVFIEGSIIVLRFLQIIISKFKSNPL